MVRRRHRLAGWRPTAYGFRAYGVDGRTHVSERARQAVLPSRSPRCWGTGRPAATRPLSATRALRAGMKQLYTPWGRPGTLPAPRVRTKGSVKPDHVSEMSSPSDRTVSVQAVRVSPSLPNLAPVRLRGTYMSLEPGPDV